MTWNRVSRRLTPLLVLLVLLAIVPYLNIPTGGALPDRLSAPGSLQLLGLCLTYGALALTYDLLFGFTGLLSFGHALFFAAGGDFFAISLADWHLSGPAAVAVTLGTAIALPLVIGAVSLRTAGIAFAMVTLAFAQAGSVLVNQDPHHLTGGELGLGVNFARLPADLVGVTNTRYLYWLALLLLLVVSAAVAWALRSAPGRVWPAIRDNEQRVLVLGLRPYGFKLLAFVLASFLAALCGIVDVLLVGTANPSMASATFTLSLLVMVVLGGTGTGWGAVLGGIVYGYLDQRLPAVTGSATLHSLPALLRVPLSQPDFILGAIFIAVILFFPGGLAGLLTRHPRRDTARRLLRRAIPPAAAPIAATTTSPAPTASTTHRRTDEPVPARDRE